VPPRPARLGRRHREHRDGDLRAVAWRRGKYTFVAVGPDANATAWLASVNK
jgi:hypothetical protein